MHLAEIAELPDVSPTYQLTSNVERKLIKSGELTIEVGDLNSAEAEVKKLCNEWKSYISNQTRKNDFELQTSFTIRVPEHYFGTLVAQIGLINIWPFLILFPAGGWLGIRFRRRRKP